MIHVIATIRHGPGRREDFLADFRRAWCPRCGPKPGASNTARRSTWQTSISVDQPAPREDVVTVIEKWESVAALRNHLAAPHMARYRRAVKDMVLGVEIRVLEPAE